MSVNTQREDQAPRLSWPDYTHWLDLDEGQVWTVTGTAAEYRDKPHMSQLDDEQLEALNKWVEWQIGIVLSVRTAALEEQIAAAKQRIAELEACTREERLLEQVLGLLFRRQPRRWKGR